MVNEVISCSIRENSRLAWLAARKLGTRRVAITLGRRIYLWNVKREDFLNDKPWLRHELCHVQQFRKLGFIRFLCCYFIESLFHGYEQNKFEIEARMAEQEEEPLQCYRFI